MRKIWVPSPPRVLVILAVVLTPVWVGIVGWFAVSGLYRAAIALGRLVWP